MEKLAFTICSNNYLAQAKALGDSLVQHNPDYRFIICLVDKQSSLVDYNYFKPHEILPVEQVPIADFENMILKYDITELNTAVKPFVFKFLFSRSATIANVTYLDPDIIVYDRFSDIENAYSNHTFILTPHINTPIHDQLQLGEESFLNCGIYNLGFLGLNRTGHVFEFLDWWMERLKDRCYNKPMRGWFVDQIWINFVPVYYEGAFIMKHPGHNMAYWNLHERQLQCKNGKYYVNETLPLVFYHFSGYNAIQPEGISKYQNRFTFETRPDLVKIFEDYRSTVLQNKHEQFFKIPCYFAEVYQKAKAETGTKNKIDEVEKSSFKRSIKITLRRILHLDN